MMICGIDPGLRYTGWAIVRGTASSPIYVASGRVKSNDKDPLAVRLATLFTELQKIIQEWEPMEVAVEETFVNQNPTTTLKLGSGRAVSLLVPALADIPVFEYKPNTIKKTVVGVGHADKQQVDMMVKVLLPKANPETPDEADAIAIALCHLFHQTPLNQQTQIM